MFLVMFVSKDVEQAGEVLQMWIKAGVEGVTILESAGLRQALDKGFRDDVGILFSFTALMRAQEVHHRTLFSAVRDQAAVDQIVRATTAYVRDWTRPDVGVLFVLPMSEAYGLDKNFSR